MSNLASAYNYDPLNSDDDSIDGAKAYEKDIKKWR